jgi:hypothetical protein
MKALDKQAWAEAYNSEYLGFVERGVFKVVKPEPGERIHDTITDFNTRRIMVTS